MIAKLGRDKVSAFLLEVIGGATTGAAVPPAEYFKVVREICDQNDVLLIADEVMTGIGRTGKWLAGQHFNLIPDLIVMGKGLTGGYVPMSALAAPKKHVDVIFDKKKSFLHAQTFAHHPVGCAAGLATLKYLKKNKLVEKSAKLGRRLLKSIAGLQKYPHVGDVRGQGLFVGVEFVQDKKTRKPFPRAMKYAENFSRVAMEKGLVLWSNVGQADGTNGDLVLLAPPLIITEEEIDLIREKMDDILSEMDRSFHS
jgi:adenosylmethionine-8-amino-7-oxononanoate aminotransferase